MGPTGFVPTERTGICRQGTLTVTRGISGGCQKTGVFQPLANPFISSPAVSFSRIQVAKISQDIRDIRQHSEMIHDEIPNRCMLAQSSYNHFCGTDDLRIEESCDDQCQEKYYSTDEQSRVDTYITKIPDINSCY